MKPADPSLAVAAPTPKMEAARRGVHSEVGRLLGAIVCRPGLAHLRLTPRNCARFGFDAVLWVEQAQREFDHFVRTLTRHGVEVLELHEVLAQTLGAPDARRWLLQHHLRADAVGADLLDELHAALESLAPDALAHVLLGGLTRAELPFKPAGASGAFLALHDFVLPPLPHALFARDASSWYGNGVSLNPLCADGRRGETLLTETVYRFHPRFAQAGGLTRWQDARTVDADGAALEGGDIMVLGDGVLLVGLAERGSAHAAMRLAQRLFDAGAARSVITAQLPPGTRHLNSVFTQVSTDAVTYRPEVVDRVVCCELLPALAGKNLRAKSHAGKHLLDVLSDVLQVRTLRALSTGDDGFDGAPEQWDDGNGVLALEPGVVIGYDRSTSTNRRLRAAGIEVLEIPGGELARTGVGPHAFVCPLQRERVVYR